MLSAAEVEARATMRVGNEPSRLNKALADLDAAADQLGPTDSLREMLNMDYQVDVEHFFALDLGDRQQRMRALAARAYARLCHFTERALVVNDRDDSRRELEATVSSLEAKTDRRLQPAIDGLKVSLAEMRPRVSGNDPRADLLWEAGSNATTEREMAEDLALLNLDDTGIPRLEEVLASEYPDQEFVQRLREALDRHALGEIALDAVDFHVLQLAEIYAFCFGRVVPTWYHEDIAGADKEFLAFVDANFALADMAISSREGILRHWRRFPKVKYRLALLTSLGSAARLGDAPPFYLEERREITSLAVLEDIDAMTSL